MVGVSFSDHLNGTQLVSEGWGGESLAPLLSYRNDFFYGAGQFVGHCLAGELAACGHID